MRLEELSFIIIVAVMVAFYLIFIRPAQGEQRRRRKEISDLQPGDDVLTTAGFIARVQEIETPEDGPVILHLELAPGVRVKALLTAVQQRVPRGRMDELSRGARLEQPGGDAEGDQTADPPARHSGRAT